MIDIPTGIAAEIRGEMGKRQISMKELANQTGMSYASIIRKINEGSRQLSIEDLSKISNALGIKISTLVTRVEQALDTTPPNPTNNPPALADSGRVVSFVLDGRELHINETKAEQVFEHMQVCQVCNGFEQAFAHVRDFQEGL